MVVILKKFLFTGIMLSICVNFLLAQTAEAPSAGDGSSDNPYQITSLANLRWLSENSSKWHRHTYFIQTADIDASATQSWNDGAGFSPIGKSGTYVYGFKGNYNGNGHTISGLYINRESSNYQGLFGYVGYEGSCEISGLGLIDVNITGSYSVGGLIGCNSSGQIKQK